MPAALLLTVLCARALTSHQSGPAFDLAAGVGIGDRPVAAMVGGQLSLGWWTGVYDDQYAFGRSWWFGATGRVDWRPSVVRAIPMVEIRRSVELFFAGLAVGLAGGVVAEVPDTGLGDPFGWTARAVVQAKLRRTRFVGISLRLEGGVDRMGELTAFGGGVLLGISYARPARAIEEPKLDGGDLPPEPVDGSENQQERQEGQPDRALEDRVGVGAAGRHAHRAGPGGGREQSEGDHR